MIAVYGATGHTGRLVAGELAGRGHEALLLGRSAARLAALARQLGGDVRWRALEVEESEELRAALAGCAVVINCAGPFSQTAWPVAATAVDVGTHYVDVTAEPPVMKDLDDRLGGRAADSGVALVAGAGFYFTLSDCLTRRLAASSGSLSEVTRPPHGRKDISPPQEGVKCLFTPPGRGEVVTIAYLVENWRMTRGSRETAIELAGQPRLVYEEGRLRPGPADPLVTDFDFPAPHGRQEVFAYPGGEVVTVPRHTHCERVDVLMTTSTFGPDTFAGDDIGPDERAGSAFVVVVDASGPSGRRRGWIAGQDIYRTGAVTAVEAASALSARSAGPAGALSPAQVLDADHLFSARTSSN